MTLFAIFTPAINTILFTITGRNVRLTLLPFIAMFSVLALLVSILPEVVRGCITSTPIGGWIYSGLFEVDWAFGVDPLTYVMLFVVLTVSSLVHLYSTSYMGGDPHLARFMSYLSLFTFFMLLLVSSENLVSLFLGWEGVGLCSYLLISFWFTRAAANKAAIKAMIVNRVADLALTIGILAAFFIFQTVEFSVLFGLAPFATDLSLVTFLLFVGAMGKSAQIGLHTWLPDAMEGPTPVSALIHAATMVTAGVFLIIRCAALFEQTPDVLLFVTFIGAATAFMAATSGLLQNDLKKIIAYSTCSQLGYMVFICGLSGYAISFFHLTNHAFFKALLFLSAGAVIHSLSNEQDLRRLGGLIQLLPFTYVMFLVGSLALMGLPFLTGFYSKDLILEVAASQLTFSGTFAYWLGLVTALFTAFYSFRLLHLAFYSAPRSPRPYLAHAHELPPTLAIPLAVLALGSIFFGFLARDLFIGLGTTFWNGIIPTSPLSQLTGEFLAPSVKMAPLAGSTVSVCAVFFVTSYPRALYRFLSHKWYFDAVYNRLVNQPLLQAAYHAVFKPVDKGVLEFAGPTGLGEFAVRVGYYTTTAQTGRVYDYAWFIFSTLLLLLVGVDAAYLTYYGPHPLEEVLGLLLKYVKTRIRYTISPRTWKIILVGLWKERHEIQAEAREKTWKRFYNPKYVHHADPYSTLAAGHLALWYNRFILKKLLFRLLRAALPPIALVGVGVFGYLRAYPLLTYNWKGVYYYAATQAISLTSQLLLLVLFSTVFAYAVLFTYEAIVRNETGACSSIPRRLTYVLSRSAFVLYLISLFEVAVTVWCNRYVTYFRMRWQPFYKKTHSELEQKFKQAGEVREFSDKRFEQISTLLNERLPDLYGAPLTPRHYLTVYEYSAQYARPIFDALTVTHTYMLLPFLLAIVFVGTVHLLRYFAYETMLDYAGERVLIPRWLVGPILLLVWILAAYLLAVGFFRQYRFLIEMLPVCADSYYRRWKKSRVALRIMKRLWRELNAAIANPEYYRPFSNAQRFGMWVTRNVYNPAVAALEPPAHAVYTSVDNAVKTILTALALPVRAMWWLLTLEERKRKARLLRRQYPHYYYY